MRILVVEDDVVLGDALNQSLKKAGYAVDLAEDGRYADNALREQVYDAVVLDIGLPHIDGFEVLRRLRARNSQTSVIILTAREDTDDVVKALDLGADDYLSKPFKLPELEARLRAQIRRKNSLATSSVEFGRLKLDTKTHLVTADEVPLGLSPREIGVLELLLLRSGRVVSKESLVEGLCNWDEDVGTNAIEVYVHRLRRKLEPFDITIVTVRGIGYMLDRHITKAGA
jgi:two-component system, OmpR family, response regulator